MDSFDVVVVGGGPAGEVAAGRLADAGLDVALVEDDVVGGECSFYACMPSKALLRPQEILREIHRIPGAAEAVTGELDVQAVLDRRDEVIHDLDDSSMLPWLEDRGIKLYRGFGVLNGEKRVDVGDDQLEARQAVILSGGTRAAIPPIEGLREAEPWTNREATTAKQIPDAVVVLGGGVFGTELAQAYRSLGAEVTLIEGERRAAAHARRSSPASRSPTRSSSRASTSAPAARRRRSSRTATRCASTWTTTRPSTPSSSSPRSGGRRGPGSSGSTPSTSSPATAATSRSTRTCRSPATTGCTRSATSTAASCSPTWASTRRASRSSTSSATRRPPSTAPTATSPRAWSSPIRRSPPSATRRQSARDAGLDFHILEVGTSANAGGSYYGRNAPGTSRLLVDKDCDLIIGATITGAEVADFLHAATIAIVGEIPMGRLWHATPSFPTRSEIWLNLMAAWEKAKGELEQQAPHERAPARLQPLELHPAPAALVEERARGERGEQHAGAHVLVEVGRRLGHERADVQPVRGPGVRALLRGRVAALGDEQQVAVLLEQVEHALAERDEALGGRRARPERRLAADERLLERRCRARTAASARATRGRRSGGTACPCRRPPRPRSRPSTCS